MYADYAMCSIGDAGSAVAVGAHLQPEDMHERHMLKCLRRLLDSVVHAGYDVVDF